MEEQKKRLKVSFDFDGTLEFSEVQEVAKDIIERGDHEVCILTTRYKDPMNYPWAKKNSEYAKTLHDELYKVAKELGITEIHFTDYEFKTGHIDKYGIDVHLDDNYRDEVYVINEKNKAKAIHYNYGWKKRFYEAIGLPNEFQNGTKEESNMS